MDRAIITSASNKFFPSLLNLLGSIRANYQDAPKVFVYDLGLLPNFKAELETIANVTLLPMPKFCKFWRSCYTWKCYILSHPLADQNLYLDAGCQVLRPLDEIYGIIEKDGYFAVNAGPTLESITPKNYKNIFKIEEKYYSQTSITAGVFGFKNDPRVLSALSELYDAALAGLALGFSPVDQRRNRGVNKTIFVRDCQLFRHDTTLLSLILRRRLGDLAIQSVFKYAGSHSAQDHPQQLIWNMRMNYLFLDYLSPRYLHQKRDWSVWLNRFLVYGFLLFRFVRLTLGRQAKQIKSLKHTRPKVE